ncbi:MAG TPA: hypothetical protein VNU93_04715 [Verrucomicrobiae bacterium]|nr:hypothetical protein [Verrucomicrobiae bacterium]
MRDTNGGQKSPWQAGGARGWQSGGKAVGVTMEERLYRENTGTHPV